MESTDVYVAPGGGALIDLGGLGVHFKVRGEQTGGSFAIVEHPIEPGILVEPHIHRNEDEMSYVLNGTIWARVGDREVEAVAGSYVWKPRGVLHTFWNPGPEPARILEIITPAGVELLFEQIALLLERSSDTTEGAVYELCRQYGLSFDRSWVPDLESRFGQMQMVWRWRVSGTSQSVVCDACGSPAVPAWAGAGRTLAGCESVCVGVQATERVSEKDLPVGRQRITAEAPPNVLCVESGG